MTDPSLRIPKLELQPAQPSRFPGRAERQAARAKRQADAVADMGALTAMHAGRYRPQSNIGKTEMKDAPIKPSDKGVWGKIWDSYQNVTQGLGSIFLGTLGEYRPPIFNLLQEGYIKEDDPLATRKRLGSIVGTLGPAGQFLNQSMIQSNPELGLTPQEQDRVDRTRDILGSWMRGEVRREDAWEQLVSIQNERPWGLQMGSEMIADPTNLLPFGLVKTGLRAPVTAIRSMRAGRIAEGIRPTDAPFEAVTDVTPAYEMAKLPTVKEAKMVMQSDETDQYLKALWGQPFIKWAAATFGEHGLADFKNKGVQLLSSIGFYQAATKTNADMDAAYILRNGSARNKFQPNWKDGDMSVDPAHLSRKEGTAPSYIEGWDVRPGGERIALSSERLREIIPDIFAGRMNIGNAAKRTGLSAAAIGKQQQKARVEALRSIFEMDGPISDRDVRRKVLSIWGVEDVIVGNKKTRKITDQTLRKYLQNPEIARYVDQELSAALRGRASGTRNVRGQWSSGFLRDASRQKIFDDAMREFLLESELKLLPQLPILPGMPKTYLKQRDKVYFDEYLQNPELFNASPELELLRKDYTDVIGQYVAEGTRLKAIPDTDFVGNVPGNWTSAIWKTVDHVTSEGNIVSRPTGYTGRTFFGGEKVMENSRIRDFLADSYDLGFRTGYIDEGIHETLYAFQQMMGEKVVMDSIAAWTPALRKRIVKGGDAFLDDLVNLKQIDKKVLEEARRLLKDKTNPGIELLYKGSSVARGLETGLDIGAPAIHGAALFFSNPVAWGRGVKVAWQNMLDPTGTVQNKYLANNWQDVQEMAKFNGITLSDAEYMESFRQGSGWIDQRLAKLEDADRLKTGFLGKTGRAITQGASRNFNGFLFAARVEAWKSMRSSALEHAKHRAAKQFRKLKKENFAGQEHLSGLGDQQLFQRLLKGTGTVIDEGEETRALRMLSEHVNKLLGTLDAANTGLRPSRRKALGAVFMYAPRYRLAGYALMADALRGGYRGHMAREKLGNLLTSGSMWYAYVCNILEQEPQLNPLEPGFMAVKIGEQTIGIGSMHVTMMRFMMNLVSQGVGLGVRAADAATDEDLNERIRNLPDGGLLESALDNGQEANIFKFSGDNTLLKFLRGQIAPLTGASWDIATGRNFIGEPTDENLWGIDFNSPSMTAKFGNAAFSYLTPFWVSGMFSSTGYRHERAADNMSDGHPFISKMGGGLAEFGGLRSYSVSSGAKAMDIAEEEIQLAIEQGAFTVEGVAGDVQWTDLNGIQKQYIKDQNPRIQEFLDLSRQRWADIGTGPEGELSEAALERTAEKSRYISRLDEINKFMIQGHTGDPDRRFTGEDFRRQVSAAGRLYSDNLKRINEELSQEARDVQLDRATRRVQEGDTNFFDLAYYTYIQAVYAPNWELPSGEFNFTEYQFAQEDFYSDWTGNEYGTVDGTETGELHDVVKYIQEMQTKDFPDIVVELKVAQDQMRPYWEVPDKIMTNLGMTGLISVYEEYRSADPATQTVMKTIYPWITQIDSATRTARTQIRETNLGIDHFFIRYGYSGTPRHPSLVNINPMLIERTPLTNPRRLWD